MIALLAHITPVEAPAGALMFLAGAVVGVLVATLYQRFKQPRI